jgi:oligopeptide/dipeptide ABC transporter ATP-binding protein
VEFALRDRTVPAVNGVSLDVRRGEAVGIVGESGCGKSVTSYSVMQILAKNARITEGEILYRPSGASDSTDLATVDPHGDYMRSIRGAEISMIFQEPMTAFSPVHRVGDQITDVIRLHEDVSKEEARNRAVDLLQQVGITDAENRIDEYTFQFSGGMRQRAMIAMALACNPELLIADEPTTALDVTIQAQVLKLINRIREEFGLSLVLITHDLGVIAQTVSYVYVMYLGKIVEEGPVEAIFDTPKHPYTMDLLDSIPRMTEEHKRLSVIRGSVPGYLPSGCPFHTRCPRVVGPQCSNAWPARTDFGEGHAAHCYLYTEEAE